jgi:hypothetical protein
MPCSWAGRTNIPIVLAQVHPAVCREGLGRNKTVPDKLHDSLATSFGLPSRPTGMLRELPLRVLTTRNRGAALCERRGDGLDRHAMWHEAVLVGAYDASGKGGYRGDKDYSPHPRSRVPGATLLESNKAVLRLVFITCSQSSAVISSRSC